MRWHCEKCQREVNVGLTECPYCAAHTAPAPANEKTALWLRLVWAGIGLGLAALSGIALYLVYRAFIQPG